MIDTESKWRTKKSQDDSAKKKKISQDEISTITYIGVFRNLHIYIYIYFFFYQKGKPSPIKHRHVSKRGWDDVSATEPMSSLGSMNKKAPSSLYLSLKN